jgi:hypothetical protein
MVARLAKLAGFCVVTAFVAGCGGDGGLFSGERGAELRAQQREAQQAMLREEGLIVDEGRETIFDLFTNAEDPNNTVEVNRYLWNASLEILDFMPIEAADPFSGIIQFGYGTPPGGARAYRATVYVQDPALEARSLRVAVQSRGGAVSRSVARQIEDAILTRARQIRIRDGNL